MFSLKKLLNHRYSAGSKQCLAPGCAEDGGRARDRIMQIFALRLPYDFSIRFIKFRPCNPLRHLSGYTSIYRFFFWLSRKISPSYLIAETYPDKMIRVNVLFPKARNSRVEKYDNYRLYGTPVPERNLKRFPPGRCELYSHTVRKIIVRRQYLL